MIVVADSSPLVALVNIKQVEILPRLFGAVLIPPEVHSDEKAGRRIAAERHLPVAGTVGVLERAAEQQLLNLREVFDLLKNTDFWVGPALLDARLEAFEQKQAFARSHQPGFDR